VAIVVAAPMRSRTTLLAHFLCVANFKQNTGGRTNPKVETQKQPTNEMMRTKPGTNAARKVQLLHNEIRTNMK
jgi:hypothetical protein